MDRLPDALEKYVERATQAVFDGFVGGTSDPTLLELSVSIAEGHARTAILAFLNAAEKDGWGMRPREATPVMIAAGLIIAAGLAADPLSCDVDGTENDIYPVVYRAMLDAAKEEGNE